MKTKILSQLLNPNSYNAIEELQLMRSFRLQLKYQREYLLQCKIKPFLESENFQFSHFDYERIDWYSLNDFLAIGEMLKKLQTIAKDGRNHIVNCEWCRQLGCICELCSDDEVIFPFDADLVYRVSVRIFFLRRNRRLLEGGIFSLFIVRPVCWCFPCCLLG